MAVTRERSGIEGGEIGERDFARADAPPEVGAVARDDFMAVAVAPDDEFVPPPGAAVDAHGAVRDGVGLVLQIDDAGHAPSRGSWSTPCP